MICACMMKQKKGIGYVIFMAVVAAIGGIPQSLGYIAPCLGFCHLLWAGDLPYPLLDLTNGRREPLPITGDKCLYGSSHHLIRFLCKHRLPKCDCGFCLLPGDIPVKCRICASQDRQDLDRIISIQKIPSSLPISMNILPPLLLVPEFDCLSLLAQLRIVARWFL